MQVGKLILLIILLINSQVVIGQIKQGHSMQPENSLGGDVKTSDGPLFFKDKSLTNTENVIEHGENENLNRRLYIGDKVPLNLIELNDVRNYLNGKVNMSAFKGKYIIMDFWTKYCSSCIAAFPKMEELQEQFKDDIQILLVTKNKNEELSSLFSRSPIIKRTKLPMVIGDSILTKKLFPHGTVPYHVWLDREGKVIATTYAQETNASNLKKLISGGRLNLLVRNDIFNKDIIREVLDQKIPLLKIQNGFFADSLTYFTKLQDSAHGNKAEGQRGTVLCCPVINEEAHETMQGAQYYSLFMKFLEGDFPTGSVSLSNSVFLDKDGNQKGFRVVNSTIDNLYRGAFVARGIKIYKIIAEDKARSIYEYLSDTTNRKRYLINNSYCYESSLPNYSFDNARIRLQQDLINFFGMVGRVEERPVKCLVLSWSGTANETNLWAKDNGIISEDGREVGKRKNGYIFRNANVLDIYSAIFLANRSIDDPIILEDPRLTGEKKYYEKKIDISLECKSLRGTEENIPLIRKALSFYGLELREEVRKMKVLVLTSEL